MWINRKDYEIIMKAGAVGTIEKARLKVENEELRKKVADFEDNSGEKMLTRFKNLAKECNIDVHGTEYQTFMNRMFVAVAGRSSPEAKAYSLMAFVKDNPQELLDRAEILTKQASIITKEIENKKKK